MKSTGIFASVLLISLVAGVRAQESLPKLVPDAIDFRKLIPVLPEPPSGWKADKPEGSALDMGGFTLSNAHRDYRKGEGDNVPSVSISVLDSVASPEYVSATTENWKHSSETLEGYGKAVTIDGNPGFEAYEKENKHGSLWVMVANRYFVQIELHGQDAKELREWIKHVDLKKLAAIK